MTDKDSDWQDKAKQYLRAEKRQLEEENREAELMKKREAEDKKEEGGNASDGHST